MENLLYSYCPIHLRPRIVWPGGARVAFYIGLNIEHFHIDKPSTSIWSATSALIPDPLNYGWRDYGARVGIWRVIDILDRYGIRASALLNSEAALHYPQIIEAGTQRNWAWLAHGKTNSELHTAVAFDDERILLRNVIDTIAQATGKRPKG